MTDSTTTLDLSQRIAKALARTDEPHTATGSPIEAEGMVIGKVPLHLRHMLNLLEEMTDEAEAAMVEARRRQKAVKMVHAMFSDGLLAQLPKPEKSEMLTILQNWDVVATEHDEADALEIRLGDLLGSLLGRRPGH